MQHVFTDSWSSEDRIRAAEIINKHLQNANRELIGKFHAKIKGVERGHYGLGSHLVMDLIPVKNGSGKKE
jgi:hypothetical protein